MTNMVDLGINLEYTKGLPIGYYKYNKEVLPSSYAMYWCMMATGFNRIFTRDDMKEFLFRLAITLHSLSLVETWFIKDRLMTFKLKGVPQVLELDDIIMHFGLEIADSTKNFHERDHFLKSLHSNLKSAFIAGAFAEIMVVEPEAGEDDEKIISIGKHCPEINAELISKAEFFSRDLMRQIPDEIFIDRNPLITLKEAQIEERKERIKNLPVFDIEKIPQRIIEECLYSMFKEDFAKRCLENREDFEMHAKPLIYLAWLWANNLMESDGVFAHEKEGIQLDYDDYKLEDGGINLLETINKYNLEKLSSLLRKEPANQNL